MLFIAAIFTGAAAVATPRLPGSDDEVLERLPLALLATRSLIVESNSASHAPDVVHALASAKRFIEIGQTYSDPREYGYAQAALGSWWDADPAPDAVLVMRARILQFRHEFPASLHLLETALKHDQFNPDAWLLFASIEQVQGNVAASRSACLKLIPMTDPLVGATCVAATAGLTARAKQGDGLLADALQKSSAAPASERLWAWTTLAELRARTASTDADVANAEAAFRSALEIGPNDVYARAAFADFLLEHRREKEVRGELGDETIADAVLLRATIAAHRTNDRDADDLSKMLADRFDEARARGDRTHLREQARFELDVVHDASKAAMLAAQNFAVQKEPADAQILLEAAIAANDADAAKPAIEWLAATGIDAAHLKSLAATLAKSDR